MKRERPRVVKGRFHYREPRRKQEFSHESRRRFTNTHENSRNNNDDETKRMEDRRGKGGGRLKHCTVDGDVPLCLRKNQKDSNDDCSSKRKTREEKENGSSILGKTKHYFKNKMASGSEDMCLRSTEEKDEHPKKQGSDFHYSSEKHEVSALK